MAKAWTGGFSGIARPDPGPAGVGAWLKTPSGKFAWRLSERIGRASTLEAEKVPLDLLLHAAKAHKASPLIIEGDANRLDFTSDELLTLLADVHLAFDGGRSLEAVKLADEVVPDTRAFDQGKFVRISETILVAVGTDSYVVDMASGTCTCPSFNYGNRPCKHLRAAAG